MANVTISAQLVLHLLQAVIYVVIQIEMIQTIVNVKMDFLMMEPKFVNHVISNVSPVQDLLQVVLYVVIQTEILHPIHVYVKLDILKKELLNVGNVKHSVLNVLEVMIIVLNAQI